MNTARTVLALTLRRIAFILMTSRLFDFRFQNHHKFSRLTMPRLLVLAFAASLPLSSAEVPTFNRDIRPILSENCFLCHSTDPDHRGGDLRLDLRDEAIAPRDEGPAIVPGHPEKSALIRRIFSTDPDEVMPSAKAHLPPLKAAQIDTLKRWIAGGAVYESHWAFSPPKKAPLPGDSAANPVDAFVRAGLAKAGLKPSPPAAPELLVRRVFLDLTGLPPSPADTAAFLADASPDRVEKLADRLMTTPQFAERMAMPWLDAARYSDTHGFSIDDHRDMWGWRDWVIAAFFKNQPYDQFLTEQLAGDLIPNATPDQIAATGFLRNSMNTHEGGTVAEEYRVAEVIDKVDAVSTTMLGLTMKCAQCHDHKYDPIPQRDYYRFFAFFNQSSEPGLGATNGSTPPIMPYTSPLGDGGMAGVKARIAELEYLRLHPSEEILAARAAWESTVKPAPATFPWAEFSPASAKWIWAGPVQPNKTVALRREITLAGPVEEAWLFTTCDDSSVFSVNGQTASKVVLWMNPAVTDVTALLKPGTNVLEAAAANAGGAGGFIASLAVRTASGWQVVSSDASWLGKTAEAADFAPVTVIASFGDAPWNDVTATVRPAKDTGLATLIAISPAERTPAQWTKINEAFLKSADPLVPRMKNILLTLDTEIKVLQPDVTRGKTTVMVMDHKPDLRKTHILTRGAYDQPADEVTPGTPTALPAMTAENPTRLDLAHWMVSPNNPLPARVAVNHLWQLVFGRGLVETAGDFGNQGAWPTHPELLDWLAVDLMDHQWDLRHVLRTIISSETYRQSAATTPDQLELDPRDELLSRSPRPRLPAEILRDETLAVSGLLDETLGGPGVHPPQPELWSEISHFGYQHPFTAQIFLPGCGASAHRRSIYTFWKRTSPPPSLALFDAPTRETCTVVRGNTNTPLQALVLMNDPQFVEAAIALGRRMLAEGGETPAARANFGFRLATGRAPTADESALLEKSWAKHHARYAADPAAATAFTGELSPDLATAAMLSSILLNLDEFVSRP